MTRMTREEMLRQDRLPIEQQSEEFLRMRTNHGSPCPVHGGKCDHNGQWMRFDHAITCARGENRDKTLFIRYLLEKFEWQTVYVRPWSTSCHFELEKWIREGSYAVRHKDRKRMIEGLAIMQERGYMFFVPDEGEQYIGTLSWNTVRIPHWTGEGANHKHKEDRILLTIDELVADGKLSESFTQRPSASEWAALRTFVLERDNYTCQYCSKTTGTMHVDHITPVGRGGSHPDNLVTACQSCNLQKHSRTPEEWLS